MSTSDRTSANGDAPRVKREYRRPVLVEYGPISKLTRSGGNTRNEPSAPLMRLMA